MRFAFFVFLLISSFGLSAQSYSWKLLKSYPQENIEAWAINPLEELIISSQGTLHKLNADFKIMFTQSEKWLGDISEIDARQSLKTLLFSKSQQIIGFVDNTLSFQEDKIELENLNIGLATHVSYSDLSQQFWVYDEQNSRLIRFQGTKPVVNRIEISNLSSITNQHDPTSIMESQNQLFLFYKGSGLFIFDHYGSLLSTFDFPEAIQIYPTKKFIFLLTKSEIIKIERTTRKELRIKLPTDGIEDFQVFGNSVYFKDKQGLNKYSLIQSE